MTQGSRKHDQQRFSTGVFHMSHLLLILALGNFMHGSCAGVEVSVASVAFSGKCQSSSVQSLVNGEHGNVR